MVGDKHNTSQCSIMSSIAIVDEFTIMDFSEVKNIFK